MNWQFVWQPKHSTQHLDPKNFSCKFVLTCDDKLTTKMQLKNSFWYFANYSTEEKKTKCY